MAVDSEKKTIKDGDTEKDVLVVRFSNGALNQVEKLKEFFKLQEDTEVIEQGISLLQRFMELEKKKGGDSNDNST